MVVAVVLLAAPMTAPPAEAALGFTLTLVGSEFVVVGDQVTLTGRLSNANIPVALQEVELIVGGKVVATVETGVNGIYTVQRTWTDVGPKTTYARVFTGTPAQTASDSLFIYGINNVPLPPTNLNGHVGFYMDQYDLAWTAPPEPLGRIVQETRVYRAEGAGWRLLVNLPGRTQQFTDVSVVPVQAYTYRVVSWNLKGEGAAVEATFIVPPIPPADLITTSIPSVNICITDTQYGFCATLVTPGAQQFVIGWVSVEVTPRVKTGVYEFPADPVTGVKVQSQLFVHSVLAGCSGSTCGEDRTLDAAAYTDAAGRIDRSIGPVVFDGPEWGYCNGYEITVSDAYNGVLGEGGFYFEVCRGDPP